MVARPDVLQSQRGLAEGQSASVSKDNAPSGDGRDEDHLQDSGEDGDEHEQAINDGLTLESIHNPSLKMMRDLTAGSMSWRRSTTSPWNLSTSLKMMRGFAAGSMSWRRSQTSLWNPPTSRSEISIHKKKKLALTLSRSRSVARARAHVQEIHRKNSRRLRRSRSVDRPAT